MHITLSYFAHPLLSGPIPPCFTCKVGSVNWAQRVLTVQLAFLAHMHAANSYTPFNAPLGNALGPQWTWK